MNHADRERLSAVLAGINEDGCMCERAKELLDEARAIVDAPAPPQRTIPPLGTVSGIVDGQWSTPGIVDGQWPTPRFNPAAFFASDIRPIKPASEYQAIWDTRDQAQRTRNRLWIAAIAGITALVLGLLVTADAPPDLGPSHQPTPQNRLATPSPAAEDHIRATLPTRTQGTGQ
jgi:hypothetical protein